MEQNETFKRYKIKMKLSMKKKDQKYILAFKKIYDNYI